MKINYKLLAIIIPQCILLIVMGVAALNFKKNDNSKSQAATIEQKLFGVNSAGAEFNENALPGTLNNDYFYDIDQNRLTYFHNKQLTLIRLPILWERVQNQAFGTLSSNEVTNITAFLNAAQQSNQVVILDLHNYGRYYHEPLQPSDSGKFADVWKKIAHQFKDHPALYGYELMNEPHDLPVVDSWKGLAQSATDAIRSEDSSNWILVPGQSWQSARFWRDNNENLIITDPSDKLLYSAHIYFDKDYTGTYGSTYDADGANPNTGVERIQPFIEWLNAKNARGIFTEYGVPNTDPRWNVVLDNFMQVLNTNDRIVGGTYWAAGTHWGNYPLSVEPVNGQDASQMSILSKYKSGALPVVTPPSQNTYIYGTIATETTNASAEVTKGIKLAHVDLNWAAYEPQDGVYDANYINQMKQKIQTLKASGMQVVLGFGTQYAPNWIFSIPNSRYVNQYGDQYASGESGKNIPNFVFNQQVRDKNARYIARVFSDLGTDFFAVRIGGGWYGEVNLGEKSYNGHNNAYWGYDALAQGKASGLPSGISPVPVPGWIPGTSSPNHASASQFANWYMDSQNNYLKWQIITVRQHYGGYLPILFPSWGIRPGALAAAINVDLNGSTGQESTGEVPMALDFARYVSSINDAKVIPYTTWLDAPYGDDNSSDPNNWTPGHYLSSLAEAHPLKLKVWGETTGANSYTDMQRSFERMKKYGLMGIMWAFDNQLFTGGYATLDQYSALIAQYAPQPSANPTLASTTAPTQPQGTSTFTTSATVTPNTQSLGGSVTITANVASATGGTYLIDIEGKNSQGQKVFQQAFDNQVFTPGQTRTFTTTSPWVISTTGPTGAYTVQVGVFKPSWAEGLYFNNEAGSFTVTGLQAATATPRPINTPIPTPTPTRVPTTIPTPTTLPNGLTGYYFTNQTLSGSPTLIRNDAAVNFVWGTNIAPATTIPADHFSVRWTGYVIPKYSQSYTFYTQSDDGVRLWVNGVQIVNNWTDHGSTQNSGKITLTGGKKYSIRMEFYENGGDARAQLSWSSSSQSKQVIPSSQLFRN